MASLKANRKEHQHLNQALAAAARRIRLVRGLRAAIPGAFVGVGAGFLLVALTRVSLLGDWAWMAGIVMPFAGALVAAFIAMARPIRRLEAAQVVDKRLQLKEKLTAAVDMIESGETGEFEDLVIERGDAAARRPQVAKAVPVKPPRRTLWALAGALIPAVLLIVPPYVPDSIAQARQEKETVKRVADGLKEEAKALEEANPTPSPEEGEEGEKASPVEDLKAIAEKLEKEKMDRREALKELAELEKQLQEHKTAAKNARAGHQMARIADGAEKGSLAGPMAKAMSEGEAAKARQEAAKLAEKLDKGEFEKKQAENLAADLEAMANALREAGFGEIADELQKAAEAIRNGDYKKAAEHLAKADVAAAAKKMEQQNAMQQMAKELQKNPDTKAAGDALAKGDSQKVAQNLENLAKRMDNNQLTQKELERLSKTMKNAGQKGQKSPMSKPMAKHMNKANQKLDKGNTPAAAEAVRRAAQGLRQAQQQAQQAQGASNAVERARAALGMKGQGGQKMQKMQWGQKGQKGQGQGQGQCSTCGGSHGKGEPHQHGGRKEATKSEKGGLEAGSGTSKYADSAYELGKGKQLDRQDNRKSDWRKDYERIYGAERSEVKTQDTKLKGNAGEGETGYSETEGQPQKGTSSAPVMSVPTVYQDAAEDAVGSDHIPAEHRERVKRYFDQMNSDANKKNE